MPKINSSGQVDIQNLIDHLQVGIIRCSIGAKGKILYANSTYCQMFDFSPKDVQKISLSDIFPDQKKQLAFNRALTKDGAIKELEICLKGKGRMSVWCLISATGVREGDNVVAADVTIRDITDRRQISNNLQESKDLFETTFNNTAAAITVTDKNEKIIAWNPFTEKLLGMEKMDLFNKPIKELYPKKEWERMRSFRIRQRGIKLNIETQVVRKDGSVLEVNVSISVLTDSEGNMAGAIGIIHDITRQKQAEIRLKESENKIRAILDNSPVAITMTDDKERIVLWNKFTEELFGLKKADLHLQPISKLYPEKEWKRIRKMNIRKLGGQHTFETHALTKKGKEIPVHVSVNILKDEEGNVTGSVGILKDNTEELKAKEMMLQAKLTAEQASESKSMFLANMSHEVRTPMNAIMGMLDLTIETELNKEQKDNLHIAKDAADNLLGLINDILDLSKVEAGKITLESIEFHLPNVARSVVRSLDVLAKDKGLKVELDLDENVPNLVEGDPVRLRQVIINLTNNALKFTSKGKVVIRVRAEKSTKTEATFLFSVIDQGIGIPEDRLESVFEIYSQAEASTTRKYGGTGLGLAICRRLTEMMGGKIWVESEVGKGSTFNFTACFKKIDATKSQHLTEAGSEMGVTAEDIEKELKDLKVLLTEDNLVNQKIAAKMLEKQGCIVTAVDNGQLALDILEKEEFDIILMDVQMPVLGGFETTKIIRDNEKVSGKHIPIIALTGRAMEGDKKDCKEAGMDGYVSKPINRKDLFKEITNLLTKGLKK